MKNNNTILLAKMGILYICSMIGLSIVDAASTPSLGAASTYSILGGTYSNTSAAAIITGDIGFTTPPAIIPLGIHVNYGAGAPTSTARIDAATALSPGLSAQWCTFNFPSGAVNLSIDGPNGATGVYPPWVYCNVGAMTVGVWGITLNGAGTYIFRTIGALTTTDNSQITLIGASACDVFWTPTAATTLGATTTFVGTIIDNANAITVGANTIWTWRALSLGAGTITTGDTVTITAPICAPIPATLHIIKQVSGGVAIPSLFDLHVKLSGVDILGSPATGTGTPGRPYSVSAGTYVISEAVNTSYIPSFSGDCDVNGNVTLLPGNDKTCIVTNTYIPPISIIGPGGGAGGPDRGSGAIITIDICPSGDFSGNFHDEICGSAPSVAGTGSASTAPVINITKRPSQTVPFPFGWGDVTYTYSVRNPGIIAMHDITVTDDKCAPVTLRIGDINHNNLLDVTERWIYRCRSNIQFSTTNIAKAEGQANGFTVTDSASATVLVSPPPSIDNIPITRVSPHFPNTGIMPKDENISWNIILFASILVLVSISYITIRKNTQYIQESNQD